jgi:S-adenosylmethionine:tRNA ribosyltransferase-isomerase
MANATEMLTAADRTPEARGLARDEVRLLVTGPRGDDDRAFRELPELLRSGDLLVVNESATLAASLPADGPLGPFRLNLSTEYGERLWLAEPRWSHARPGPLPLPDGSRLTVAGLAATIVARYPSIPRLAFVRFDGDVTEAIERAGRPIRYGYLAEEPPISAYQTIFARVPGSVEMPSAGRPFSDRVLADLERRGVALARIVLHAGVSSLEAGDDVTGAPPLPPEPYAVPAATVEAIAAARRRCGRVVAVGTTVVRALESAVGPEGLRPSRGFTRRCLAPPAAVVTVDALLTGFHTASTTHLAMLRAIAGEAPVERSYRRARASGYLWHEFGDVQLLWAAGR